MILEVDKFDIHSSTNPALCTQLLLAKNVPAAVSMAFPALILQILGVLLLVALLQSAVEKVAEMFPAWLQPSDGEWPEPFFKTASAGFPETAPMTAPPATIELTAVEMLLYTKTELQGLDDGSSRQTAN